MEQKQAVTLHNKQDIIGIVDRMRVHLYNGDGFIGVTGEASAVMAGIIDSASSVTLAVSPAEWEHLSGFLQVKGDPAIGQYIEHPSGTIRNTNSSFRLTSVWDTTDGVEHWTPEHCHTVLTNRNRDSEAKLRTVLRHHVQAKKTA